jgi:hypothetical protein
MGTDPWWIWLLPLVFSLPWLAAIALVLRRKVPGDGALPPSMAELWRRL